MNQHLGRVDRPFPVGDPGQMPWHGSACSRDTQEHIRTLMQWFGKAITHPKLVGAHYFPFRRSPGAATANKRGKANR